MTLLDRETDRQILLHGPRLSVRPFTRTDVDVWQTWPDYDELLIVGTSPRRMNAGQRTDWFRDLVERQRQIPFAVDDSSGRMIGRLFLRQVRRPEGIAVLGIDLHPAALGQGYGTEALRIFLPYYFGALGFRRLMLSVAAFNERARRCYDTLGFRVIGSHWDIHPGPDPTREPAFGWVRPWFRRGSVGVESLFYDMALDRDGWEAQG